MLWQDVRPRASSYGLQHRRVACTKKTLASKTAWNAPLKGVKGRRPIVALGKFDSLHLGHKSLAVQAAKMGGTPWLISFSGMAKELNWPPRAPIVPDCQRRGILTSWRSSCRGIRPRYRALPFKDVRSMQPPEFVDLLANNLKADGVVVGRGYRFGFKQSGDADTLRDLGEQAGMRVEVMDLVAADKTGHVSSTEVRKALKLGQMDRVSEILGRPYQLTAMVQSENGPSYDSATQTLRIPNQHFVNQLPQNGEYSVQLTEEYNPYHQMHKDGYFMTTIEEECGVFDEEDEKEFQKELEKKSRWADEEDRRDSESEAEVNEDGDYIDDEDQYFEDYEEEIGRELGYDPNHSESDEDEDDVDDLFYGKNSILISDHFVEIYNVPFQLSKARLDLCFVS